MSTTILHLGRLTLLIGVLLATRQAADAATILGQVNFTGTVTLDAPLATATAFTSFSNVQVDAGTGDYAVPTLVPLNTAVSITSFTFQAFTPPVAPLWTFSAGGTDYSFELSTLAITRGTLGPNNFLSLSGTGTARATGFDDTTGDFVFSAQQAVGAAGTTVTFSVENVVPSMTVPEPGLGSLASIALLAAIGRRRRETA